MAERTLHCRFLHHALIILSVVSWRSDAGTEGYISRFQDAILGATGFLRNALASQSATVRLSEPNVFLLIDVARSKGALTRGQMKVLCLSASCQRSMLSLTFSLGSAFNLESKAAISLQSTYPLGVPMAGGLHPTTVRL